MQNVLTLWRSHFVCTLELQLESLQYFCLFALIKRCYSTSNALCLIGFASWIACWVLFSFVDDFVTSTVGLDSSLFHCPGQRPKCNGCSPCVSQRKFYTAKFVLSGYKICPDTSSMQFAFVTVYPLCCTYRCINYTVRKYWLILVFSTINLNWIATDHTIRDLFMYTSSIR